MGKLNDGKAPVKRETVSASANLEVVSEEKFAKRLEGLGSSSCINCQKERTKGQGHRRQNQKGKHKQVKTNSPIVIHLKDTLKAALQQRQRSVEDDSETSIRSADSEMSHDEQLPSLSKYSHRDFHRETCRGYRDIRRRQNKSKKKDKNLNALISVIEKAHLKDSRHLEYNLAGFNCQLGTKMLNNATHSVEIEGAKRRSIVECDNVDLICNDLYSSVKQPEDTESDKSSVTSSSESLSISDSDGIPADDSPPFELTTEELNKLADYTTGIPFIRYDCPPSECPECINAAWYSYQYYPFQDYSIITEKKSTSRPHGGAPADATLSLAESDDDTDSVSTTSEVVGASGMPESEKTEVDCGSDEEIEIETNTCRNRYVKPHRQLWDIDISQRKSKSGNDQSFPDSVYINLTGTDISLSVFYYHDASTFRKDSYASPSSWYPMASSYSPYYYCPSYYHHSPLYTHHHSPSFPLNVDMSLPKTAMVPPRQLKKFNASQPPQRQWISTRQPDRTRSAAIFTVMCYNVLCDKYCTRQQYGYCPSWALNWEYRKKGIMEEIRNYNADIISLQEVETDQFYNLFLPELKADGYDGIFSPKSRARTMSEQERKHVDGCAIFFRMNKFSLIKEHLIEFNQIAMANAEGSDDMLNRVMTKDNIGLAAILETKEAIYENGPPPPDKGSQKILVATAHIHWDPEFSDVKLIQTMMLMWELRQFIEEFSGQKMRPGESPNMPVLLCGDLNSLPDSGVVEYLTSGKVAANHGDFKEMCYEACLKKINHANEKEFFNHNFKLARAYNDVMPYTNYTYDFKGIIDYIFYSRDYVKILGMLGPHDEEWFRQNKVIGCPHPHMPSDHFSLFIELEMLYQSSNSTRPSLTSSTAANTQASTATTVTTSKPR
ncbi:uncharacterized protein LOC121379569 isoform X1 [Gigantopelta aegis]|uniref:uncharacterized protein LOC121379569 isoform X1 n=1 Tax=Gigantopelta aegis TaxID=1735272 RepID=UPI001B88C187|nr:uncharacterized protein LOC121379569 isoform X1 [Gigantopelta aegis]